MLERLVVKSDRKKLLIIDARSKRAFLKGHLPGAIHVDPYTPSFHLKLKGLPKQSKVLVYCRTFRRSEVICNYLNEHGYRKIIQIADGFTGWKKNNLTLD